MAYRSSSPFSESRISTTDEDLFHNAERSRPGAEGHGAFSRVWTAVGMGKGRGRERERGRAAVGERPPFADVHVLLDSSRHMIDRMRPCQSASSTRDGYEMEEGEGRGTDHDGGCIHQMEVERQVQKVPNYSSYSRDCALFDVFADVYDTITPTATPTPATQGYHTEEPKGDGEEDGQGEGRVVGVSVCRCVREVGCLLRDASSVIVQGFMELIRVVRAAGRSDDDL
ncbi:unnamed protein product [Vitrella brassicaformis CCMP3155]|uniref:Uncharacterized protein n=1 Tax=Vitrella brassicaformis (strain CCMP3155) TaxID=1169540 RepID=A0A0G4EZY4_VITBC|nr:unnamed protein product [Vitrella brassicaformis CCMP3155]|eukprot:CEM04616.1 unnamed protein product [Vitrella brassicaformis CCMP3155]